MNVSAELTEDDGKMSEQDRASRQRKMTEKGAAYCQEQQQKNFKLYSTRWQQVADELRELTVEGMSDPSKLNQLRLRLDLCKTSLDSADRKLLQVQECETVLARVNEISQEHQEIVATVAAYVEQLEQDKFELSSAHSRCSYSGSYRSSGTDTQSSRKAAAVEVARARARLKYLHIEAEKRRALDEVCMKRDVEIAEAKLKAIQMVDEETDDGVLPTEAVDPVENVRSYIKNHSVSAQSHRDFDLNVDDRTFLPDNRSLEELCAPVDRDTPNQNTNQPKGITGDNLATLKSCSQEEHNARSQQGAASVVSVFQQLSDQLTLNRLPAPEPSVFSGNPLEYPNWRCSFDTLIDHRRIRDRERLYYLQKYLAGSAKEAVEGYFLLSTEDAYIRAKNVLQERYGNDFAVAGAFRDKLESWPRLQPCDSAGLRKLSDFLLQYDSAMSSISSLRILNDERENRNILSKLPEWITLRWARQVTDHRKKCREYPSFHQFALFIQEEADIANDPVTSIYGNKGSEGTNAKPTARPKASSYAFATESSENSQAKPVSRGRACMVCSSDHSLHLCPTFKGMSSQERAEYARKHRLCFSCLIPNHRAKECRRQQICAECHRHHSTLLHDQYIVASESMPRPSVNTSANGSTFGVSYFSSMKTNSLSTMTVPVLISTPENPEHEILTYALLDTQSDTSFILSDLCEELGVPGVDVQLTISTMSSENLRVPSTKVSGLQVRANNGGNKLSLPALYTRAVMPVNRSHIPTPEIARQYPHLARIADELLSPGDIRVGLLIGYNCPKALAPKEVILPESDGPLGQRTELCWGIVGLHGLMADETDPIGVSHLTTSGLTNGTRQNERHG